MDPRTPTFPPFAAVLLMALLQWVDSAAANDNFAPPPEEQQLPLRMHSAMKEGPRIAVGQTGADITGSDNRTLRAAVDDVAAPGGGTVEGVVIEEKAGALKLENNSIEGETKVDDRRKTKPAAATERAGEPLRQDAAFELNERKATLTKLDTLPFVESDYTKRFKFDSFDNPKLKELSGRYGLADVIAPGKDEFERQVLLMDWTHRQFRKFGQPSTQARGAFEILKGIEDGHSFFCSQYAQLLVSAAASLGWIDRPLALRRHHGANKNGGSTEHSVTEIWSNEHRKWVMLDPTANMYVAKDGVPLNAWEIRQEWFYRDGKALVFTVGKDQRKFRRADLPIKLGHFEGFGDLTVDPDEPDKYGFIGWIPNTDLMDSGFDYGKMFIAKDKLCDGTQWHVRTPPANPAMDPYFPVGQAALSLAAEGGAITVTLQTLTPNFKRFEVQTGDGGWKETGDRFNWNVHPGANRLEVRTVNAFGVTGPVSLAEVEIRH